MKTQFILIVFFSLMSLGCFGFSSEKCFREIESLGFPGSSISSMTQFTSSFGGCNAFGKDEERKAFLKDNNDSLKQEIATGSGEHLQTLNELYGCNLTTPLQQNLKNILDVNGDLIFEKADSLAKSSCS